MNTTLMKLNLTWTPPIESWRLGDPKPLAETLRAHEGTIPQDVREVLADALLRGPVRTKRDLHRDALNYLYKAAMALESAEKAGIKGAVIRRWKHEAVDHIEATTDAKRTTIEKQLGKYRREVRGSVIVELDAAIMRPATTSRRYEAGRQTKVNRQKRNLPRGPNSVFALGLERDAVRP